eukprot:11395642-Prorocentrum_lima.AAC.1
MADHFSRYQSSCLQKTAYTCWFTKCWGRASKSNPMNVATASKRSCKGLPTTVRAKVFGGPGFHSAGERARPRWGPTIWGGGSAFVCQPAGGSRCGAGGWPRMSKYLL